MALEYKFLLGDEGRTVQLDRDGDGYKAFVGNAARSVEVLSSSPGLLVLRIDGKTVEVAHGEEEGVRFLAVGGRSFRLQDEASASSTAKSGAGKGRFDGNVETPMPGKVVKVMVKEGDEVEAGQTLLIVEAMKMENRIETPAKGKVQAVHVSEGDNVNFGQVLVEIG